MGKPLGAQAGRKSGVGPEDDALFIGIELRVFLTINYYK